MVWYEALKTQIASGLPLEMLPVGGGVGCWDEGSTACLDLQGSPPRSRKPGRKHASSAKVYLPAQIWPRIPGSLSTLLPGKPGAAGTPELAKTGVS